MLLLFFILYFCFKLVRIYLAKRSLLTTSYIRIIERLANLTNLANLSKKLMHILCISCINKYKYNIYSLISSNWNSSTIMNQHFYIYTYQFLPLIKIIKIPTINLLLLYSWKSHRSQEKNARETLWAVRSKRIPSDEISLKGAVDGRFALVLWPWYRK